MIKFEKQGDEWIVFYNDKPLGKVYRSWARFGGNGWSYNGKPQVWSSRLDVAKAMIREMTKTIKLTRVTNLFKRTSYTYKHFTITNHGVIGNWEVNSWWIDTEKSERRFGPFSDLRQVKNFLIKHEGEIK